MFEPVRRAARSLPMYAGIAALLFAGVAGRAQADGGPESVQQLVGAPGHTVWQITRPRVTQASTDYPQIVFTPGSTVKVTASGCVQTGGKGASSKNYVSPAGSKSATLYHGEIAIPGATQGLEFFKPAQPTVYTIPAGATLNPNYLRLGYTDNNYKDDGYTKQDDGDLNQCKGLSDAVVVIDIAPIQAVGAAPATASYDFNLQNVTIQHLRSGNGDTDVLAASVMVDGTQSNIGTQDIGKLKEGSHPVNFSVLVDSVTPTDRIAITYVVANEGHSGADAKADAYLSQAIAKGSGSNSNGAIALGVISGIWTFPFSLLHPNCDGAVAFGQITATGAELFNQTATGPYQRTISFPGTGSPDGCGKDSFYQLTYSITPVSAQTPSQAFALKINAASKAVQTNVRMINK